MTAKLSGLVQLIENVRSGSAAARASLLRDLLDIYLAQPQALTPKTREEFGAILAALYAQADDATQREIAERLIPSPAAPGALLAALAASGLHIAAPSLRAGAAFTDRALIEVIKTGGEERRCAIAQRKQISEDVAEALAVHGETPALVMLVRNQAAAITPGAMSRLVAAARRKTELQKPLTERFDLPPHLLIRMFFFIAAPLRREILARAEAIDPSLVRDAMDAIRDALLTPGDEDSAEVSDARRVVEERAAQAQIDQTFLMALIEARENASILFALAYITGVDTRAVKTMFKDATLEALAVACRASALSRETFAALAASLSSAPHNGNARAPVMLDMYEKISPEIAEKLMRFWRLRARAAADAAKIASLLHGVEGVSAQAG
ncbi:DUF2336 domain-containing protein [Hyphococcus sp.]|uniref:DUF2336 domain-containing protein n=1 Tax=Hyphococcus sp. TaxID=2038636 RepID=UPI003CCC3C02